MPLGGTNGVCGGEPSIALHCARARDIVALLRQRHERWAEVGLLESRLRPTGGLGGGIAP